jgi:hypothetical protein
VRTHLSKGDLNLKMIPKIQTSKRIRLDEGKSVRNDLAVLRTHDATREVVKDTVLH